MRVEQATQWSEWGGNRLSSKERNENAIREDERAVSKEREEKRKAATKIRRRSPISEGQEHHVKKERKKKEIEMASPAQEEISATD